MRRKACKHIGRRLYWDAFGVTGGSSMPAIRGECWGCGAAIGIGEANDNPADPVVAAAMAVEQGALRWPDPTVVDVCRIDCLICQSGYLATCIANHDAEQGK